jgi:hypothetical protein
VFEELTETEWQEARTRALDALERMEGKESDAGKVREG